MTEFSLNHLAPARFEELCVDLLQELGLKNISWRKGTDLDASPADQGRDIECELYRLSVDGTMEVEKWFVECKHYSGRSGVPFSKLESAFSAAYSERPDRLVIMTSGFLSNQTKNRIEHYISTHKPPFKVAVWEKTKLAELLSNKLKLSVKYQVEAFMDYSFRAVIHPLHLVYMYDAPHNTLDQFLSRLEEIEPLDRDQILIGPYLEWMKILVDYSALSPINDETISGEAQGKRPITMKSATPLPIQPRDVAILNGHEVYQRYKQYLYDLTNMLAEDNVVRMLNLNVLNFWLYHGDHTTLERKVQALKAHGEMLKKVYIYGEPLPVDEIPDLSHLVPGQVQQSRKIYEFYCEIVIRHLIENEL